MRLWTWQNPKLSLFDPNVKVNSLKYSSYLNDPCITESERQRFKEVYRKVWKLLGTDQILWCFTTEEDAKGQASILAFQKRGKVLWELDVPKDLIKAHYCSVAWHWILYGTPCTLPEKFRRLPYPEKKQFNQSFNDYWKGKTEEQVWDVLFLDRVTEGCSDVLIRHPIEESWVIKDPNKIGKWW